MFNLYDPEMRNARRFNVWPESPGLVPNIRIDVSAKYCHTDFAQLKAALSKAFPAIQNKKELETRFYASQQRQNQEPTDFVNDLLKPHKKLELGMSEKALVDHIFVRLEPQVLDHVEVRNPQTAIQLLEVLAKFEGRYSCKATLGSRNSNNVEGRDRNERRMSNVGNNRGNWRNSEVVHRPNNGRNDYRGSNQNNRQGNQWFESRNRFENDDRRFNDRGYQFRNRGQNDDFSRGDQRNRGSSENFSRGSRKQMGHLNVLKVNDIKGDQTQSINQSPIKLPAICMSPVELPYVPILLDETFTKELWDTEAEKSFISEKTYQKYFFYKQVDQRSFWTLIENLWRFQINKVVKKVEIEKVEIDLSKTKLEEKQKRELQDLFNSFQGLFSDKPGLTHVLYHEIDTGDNPPVVSRPYRYDRLKQEILDYHVDKMLKDGTIIPIQSPYASPVVLCRKNNGLHHRIIRKHIDLLLIILN
ncbi:uncharacterized protein TNCV_2474771 [Trichonephila clavipes]|nr:uncharacterized protein TNCV_2474771 [Trichonephila clavipes]